MGRGWRKGQLVHYSTVQEGLTRAIEMWTVEKSGSLVAIGLSCETVPE